MTKQAQLIEDLLFLPDAQERMSAIVAAAGSAPTLQETDRVDTHLVPGCQSRVWLLGSVKEGRCYFTSDADSPLVKGLVHLLCRVYDGETQADILAEEPILWEQLGLHKMLSPTRQQGLAAVRQKILQIAQQAQ
jgi:cysteine desulfuration protein SufE